MLLKKSLLGAFALVTLLTACPSKKNVIDPPTPTPPTENSTVQQLLADSLYLYAKQIYYWNTSLPDSATFKPRSYAQSDTLTGLNNELFALTQIPINPATNKPYEYYQYIDKNGQIAYSSKYSYIEKTSDLYGAGLTSSVITDQNEVKNMKMTLDGKDNDLGFTMGFMRVSQLANTPRAMPSSPSDSIIGLIRAVTNGSPAWNAGIRRGDIVAKINGNKWTYDNNFNQIVNAINGSSIGMTVYDPITKTYIKDVNFSSSLYTYNPIYKDTLITIGTKKIAYVAYKSFTLKSHSKPYMDDAFAKFSGATDLVIDLRYNGGGYVNTSEYFANLILPQSANNDILSKETYNQTMQNGLATLLKKQPVYDGNNIKQNYTYFDLDYSIAANTTKVQKQGNFNSAGALSSLYFIVSRNTASASELLINSLKPYFKGKVFLINAPFTTAENINYTYGKPVGFFEIRLGKYSVYMANFESKNKDDVGGYYQGIPTDITSNDDIVYDLGNPNEASFLEAIRRIIGDVGYQPVSSARTIAGRSAISTRNIGSPNGIEVGNPTKIRNMIGTPKLKH